MDRQVDRASAFDRASVALAYRWRHGRWPLLDRPVLFTEHVQHRKLYDRDPLMPLLADKILAKHMVAERIGAVWVTPTLWQGDVLPQHWPWRYPVVVKSRHGCNQMRVVRSAAQWESSRRAGRRWMRGAYGELLHEWLYRHIPRGLLVEPFIGTGSALPVDYKFFVFGGRVEYVQVHLGREIRHRWIVFDRAWRRVSAPTTDQPNPPRALARMIAAAEALGDGFAFVRVDLYDLAGGPRFGEMTFYPGSGLCPVEPVALDGAMGAHWQRAIDRVADDGIRPLLAA